MRSVSPFSFGNFVMREIKPYLYRQVQSRFATKDAFHGNMGLFGRSVTPAGTFLWHRLQRTQYSFRRSE